MRIYLNDHWGFTENYSETLCGRECRLSEMEEVRLPHTCKEIPYNYCDEQSYQMISGYRKELTLSQEWLGKTILLTFEGVAHDATVFVNGNEIARHQCGYTAFTCDITDHVTFDEVNVITVKVDSREQINQPPFGNVVDYLTYGGIYRDVYLEIKEKQYIEDVFVMTPCVQESKKKLNVQLKLNEYAANLSAQLTLKEWKADEQQNRELWCRHLGSVNFHGTEESAAYEIDNVRLWEMDDPNLYVLEVKLYQNEVRIDTKEIRFGFRTAQFSKEGFFLNGKKIKLRGLNRHQCYPYVGYAMPESAQKQDADILKYELCANSVRTSHYPQSQYFIDRCDEIGLLVFTEIPGWQHIGDEEWKKIAVHNVEEMVLQYRNHPSIILWGVRINESPDDHDFYEATNQKAHGLDTTRATGGVRFIKKSELLEDIYTYNDFTHDGTNEAVSDKKSVTTNMEKGYLISEYNGHMYPTKAFDDEKHRLEHTLRHARVLDAVAKNDQIAGAFAWCMFDYNTHKDFGSGDRICYHGVMDMFRNPKDAAAVYSIQGEDKTVLEVSSSMDIGEYPGGVLGNIYLYTNADSVKMYKNNEFITEYQSTETEFDGLKHGPIRLSDFIGNQLVEKEGYTVKKADRIKALMADAMTYGLNHLPLKTKLNAAGLMLFHGMKFQDGVDLYNKYISGWGDSFKSYRFEAIKDGKVVTTVTKAAPTSVQLKIEVNNTELVEKSTYDVACIRITARDEYGNLLPYCQEPVELKTEGCIELVGPNVVTLIGGRTGTYVKTTGQAGEGKLLIKDHRGKEHQVAFQVQIEEDLYRR